MTYSGVIFDFNGVLWWDEHLQAETWRLTSMRLRGYPVSDDELRRYCLGRPNRYTLEYLLGHELTREEADVITAEKEASYRELCLAQGDAFRLSPGAIALFEKLQAQNIPFTIATASEIANLNFFFEKLELARWFERQNVVYDDGLLPNKPAPDIYLRAAANLGLPPAHCVVVEDSLSGIEAASSAGIGAIVALGPASRHAHLAGLRGVHHIITSLDEFPLRLLLNSRGPGEAGQPH